MVRIHAPEPPEVDRSEPLSPFRFADSTGAGEREGETPQTSASTTSSPRTALLERLFASARDAVAAGDMEAARIAHEAAGKLLAAAPMESADATVLDMAHERGKRGRS
jgi:hypothetical protein